MHPYPAQGGGGTTAPGYVINSQMYAPQGYPPQGYPHQVNAPQGYPLQGYPPQGHPPQGFPNQNYPNQGYLPPVQPGYPQQGYAPLLGATPYYPAAGAPAGNIQQKSEKNADGTAKATTDNLTHSITKKATPTVRPKNPYGPSDEEADAAALRKAMKGFGTDEKAIIAILANRSNHQRQLIARKFTALYGKELVKDLKSELSGNFEDTVVACMMPLDQFFAKELHNAIDGIGTNEQTLIEILCTLNNTWILAVKNSYQLQFKKSLESDIKGDTSGCFERLLLSLCQGMRDENPVVNPAQVLTDVQALFKAGQDRFGTDESTFNAILSTRSQPHLREVFQEYQKTHGTPFEKVIKDEFSGSIETGLLAIVRCMTDCSNYFAKRLHDSMAGAGTNDRSLIRSIVSRSECDLGDIKIAFQKRYGKSLERYIEGDCSGDYKKMLIALVNAGN